MHLEHMGSKIILSGPWLRPGETGTIPVRALVAKFCLSVDTIHVSLQIIGCAESLLFRTLGPGAEMWARMGQFMFSRVHVRRAGGLFDILTTSTYLRLDWLLHGLSHWPHMKGPR